MPIEKRGETLTAHENFLLVISYNPGYQSVLKGLKPSTRQRFIGLEFDFPPAEQEVQIVAGESGLNVEKCAVLVGLAHRFREMKGQDLEEGVSTRLLIYCASLIADGMDLDSAIQTALIEPLTDEPEVKEALQEAVKIMLG